MCAADEYRNLEFDALLEQLSGYAGSELTRQLIRQIEVVFHPARVDENLAQTTEALRFMENKPSVSLPHFAQIEDLTGITMEDLGHWADPSSYFYLVTGVNGCGVEGP